MGGDGMQFLRRSVWRWERNWTGTDDGHAGLDIISVPLLISTVNLTNTATESYKKRNSNHHNRMRINKTAFQSNADNSQTHFWSCHLDHDPMTLLEATNLPRRFWGCTCMSKMSFLRQGFQKVRALQTHRQMRPNALPPRRIRGW